MSQQPTDTREHVGYWRSEIEPSAPGLPDPRELVDRSWPLRERVRVATYLRRGQVACVRLLVEHGAEPFAKPAAKVRGGVNVLHMAAIAIAGGTNHPSCSRTCSRCPNSGAHIDARDDWGRTPLCCAAMYGTAEDLRTLVAILNNA